MPQDPGARCVALTPEQPQGPPLWGSGLCGNSLRQLHAPAHPLRAGPVSRGQATLTSQLGGSWGKDVGTPRGRAPAQRSVWILGKSEPSAPPPPSSITPMSGKNTRLEGSRCGHSVVCAPVSGDLRRAADPWLVVCVSLMGITIKAVLLVILRRSEVVWGENVGNA